MARPFPSPLRALVPRLLLLSSFACGVVACKDPNPTLTFDAAADGASGGSGGRGGGGSGGAAGTGAGGAAGGSGGTGGAATDAGPQDGGGQ